MQWYYVEKGQQQGPVEESTLAAMVRDGRIKPDDYVWNATMGQQWARARTIPIFALQIENASSIPVVPEAALPHQASGPRGATSNRELNARARAALSGNWGKSALAIIVIAAVSIVAAILPKPIDSIVNFLIGGPLALGMAIYFLALGDAATPTVEMLFWGFKQFGTAFLAQFLINLISLACALPGIAIMIVVCGKWMLTLIRLVLGNSPPSMWPWPPTGFWIALLIIVIPVIIVSMRLAMTYFIMADDPNAGAVEVIGRSFAMMKGHCWKFFFLMLRFAGWGVLTIFTFGIGLLWLVPYMYTSMARFYRDVQPEERAA